MMGDEMWILMVGDYESLSVAGLFDSRERACRVAEDYTADVQWNEYPSGDFVGELDAERWGITAWVLVPAMPNTVIDDAALKGVCRVWLDRGYEPDEQETA